MVKTVLSVDGMSCEHCVRAITNALEPLPGILGVAVELSAKTVTVEHEPEQISMEKIRAEIEDQGYEVID